MSEINQDYFKEITLVVNQFIKTFRSDIPKASTTLVDNLSKIVNSHAKNVATTAINNLIESGDIIVIDDEEQTRKITTAMVVTAGIELAEIAMMETHMIGGARLERDLMPKIKELVSEYQERLFDGFDGAESTAVIIHERKEALARKNRRPLTKPRE